MQTENGEESVNTAPQGNELQSQQPGTDVGWKFEPSDTSTGGVANPAPVQETITTESFSWTASEYIAHHKSLVWFSSVALAIVVLSLGVFLLTHEVINAVAIMLIGLSFGVFGARQPQVLQYVLDEKGLHIGAKLYPYDRIKSFSAIEEGPLHSILLMPLQRFMPPLSVYYDEADEVRIMDVIGRYIPHEDHPPDMVDRLMSKIRF